MRFPPLVPGIFLQRENRFRVQVEVHGQRTTAHLPNSGRLHDLLHPGRRVYLAPKFQPRRKTPYDLMLVDLGAFLVSVDARLPTSLFLEAWQKGCFPWLPYGAQWKVQREPPCGHGRLDLLLQSQESGRVWIETKSVTWVEGETAFFPDAPTERGRRHLMCLAEKVAQGDRAMVVFIIQRPDARRFSPHPADPAFPEALQQAAKRGVEVYAYKFQVSLEGMTPTEEVPVVLGDETR